MGVGARALSASPLNSPDCVERDDWSTSKWRGVVCPPGIDYVRATINGYMPEHITFQDLILTNNYGTSQIEYRLKRSTNNKGHMLVFPAGVEGTENPVEIAFSNASHLTNISYSATVIGVKVSLLLMIQT